MPVSMALIGLGGFGVQYVRWIQEGEITPKQGKLVAIVDPYASSSNAYGWAMEQSIPIYNTMEEMYANHKIALVLISSPTQFHKSQIFAAIDNGSHVLCEKPLTSTAQDARDIKEYAEKHGKTVGVGFQWSFTRVMQAVKNDILSGKFGKPIQMKSLLVWPRKKDYYASSSWKGRVHSKDGEPILDSIVANATAHYLHNIFFMLGDSLAQAALPINIRAELYRANNIESFDTAIITGQFPNGASLYYCASHAVDGPQLFPIFEYIFENGTIHFNKNKEDNIVYATFKDGSEIVYGDPFTLNEVSRKVRAMIDHINKGTPVACVTDTVMPHILVSNSLFSFGKIYDFPKEILIDTPERICVNGLTKELKACYESGKLPSQNNISWSAPPIEINLKGYRGYQK